MIWLLRYQREATKVAASATNGWKHARLPLLENLDPARLGSYRQLRIRLSLEARPSEMDKPQGLMPNGAPDEPEQTLWTGSYSGKAMVGHWALVSVITLVLIVVAVMLAGPVSIFVGILIGLIWLCSLGLWGVRKLGFKYELTTQRLKHRAGILTLTNDRIELIDVDDVLYKQGLVQAMLGVGNITIKSSDVSNPELVLVGIDQVRQVADMIDNARRTERRKRGLFVETV